MSLHANTPRWQFTTWLAADKVIAVLFLLLAGLVLAFLPLTLAVAVLLGATVILLTFIKPEYGLYLLVFAVPFGSIKEIETGDLKVSAIEFLVPLVLMTWIVQRLVNRDLKPKFTLLLLPVLLLVSGFSFFTTITPSLPLSIKELLKWGELAIVFYLTAHTLEKPSQVKFLVGAMIVAASLEALHGWYQFVARSGPAGFLLDGGFLRAYGAFDQPNPYAGYLGLTLSLCYGLIIGRANFKLTRPVVLVGLALFVILVAVLASFSRGAWLAFAVALLVMSLVRTKRLLAPLVVAFVLALLLLILGALNVLPSSVAERISSTTQYFQIFDANKVNVTPQNWAIVERMADWQAAWGMFADHPLSGIGLGNFKTVYHSYALPYWRNNVPDHAHNYYLNLLAEVGLPGLIIYLFFTISTLIYASISLRGTRWAIAGAGGRQTSLFSCRALTLGILGSIIALSVHNLFDDLYVHGIGVQVGMLLGLLVAVNHRVDWSKNGD